MFTLAVLAGDVSRAYQPVAIEVPRKEYCSAVDLIFSFLLVSSRRGREVVALSGEQPCAGIVLLQLVQWKYWPCYYIFSDETIVTTQPRLERQVVSHPNRCSELYVFTELLGVCGVIGSLAE